jgi:hypothetical protein
MARIKFLPMKKSTHTAEAPAKDRKAKARERVPGSRGWHGRGGGSASLLPAVREYRRDGAGLRPVADQLRHVLAHNRRAAGPA